jgi:hypothetical protein
MKNPITPVLLACCIGMLSLADASLSAETPPAWPAARHIAQVDKGITILLMLGMCYGIWRVVDARRKS